MALYRCPVCRNRVQPTMKRNIGGHTDKLGREVCPMSGEPYSLAIVSKR